jgi:hypothetical protein
LSLARQRAYDSGARAGASDFDAYDGGASMDEVRDAYAARIRRCESVAQRVAFASGYRAGWKRRLRADR